MTDDSQSPLVQSAKAGSVINQGLILVGCGVATGYLSRWYPNILPVLGTIVAFAFVFSVLFPGTRKFFIIIGLGFGAGFILGWVN